MESNRPFITIGIASYNYAHYLCQGFDAIRRQRFKNFEVIYADDGSTDNSVEMIESFIHDNPDIDIHIIRGQNIGVMGNKQRLINHARGVYLMLCDADDWMDDDCLETLATIAMETGADRIVSEIRNVNGLNAETMYVQSFPIHPSKWCETLHHGALYKLSVIRDNAVTMPDRLPDDFLFITHFNIYAKTTSFVHKSVYNWRLHPESAWHKNKYDNPWRGFNVTANELDYYTFLKKEYINCITKRDIEDLELYLVKNYCYYLIHDVSSLRLREKKKEAYNKLRSLMLRRIPRYARLVFKRSPWNSPFRLPLHLELCMLCLLEMVHCMFPALIIYGFISTLSKKHSE